MSASLVSAATAAALLIGVPMDAKAQTKSAKSRVPEVGAPVRLGPHSTVPGRSAVISPNTRQSGIVRQEDLGKISPDSMGTLSARDGGLGANMWDGTGRALVMSLLARVPVQSRSSIVRDLTRRLLLSKAAPPSGLADGDSLLSIRADRLYAMGELKGTADLLNSVVATEPDAMRARAEIESLLLLGRREAACKAKDAYLALKATEYLERATAVCYALAGDQGKASLAIGLLREQKTPLSDAFITLMGAQQKGSRVRLKSFSKPDGLTLPMLLNTKLRLPRDILTTGAPGLLRSIALSDNSPVAVRIEAGERALALGAIKPAQLTKIYTAKKVRRWSPAMAARLRLKRYSPMARAQLFQSVMAEKKSERRLQTLSIWWRLALAKGDPRMVARVTAPLLAGMVPSAKKPDDAAAAARMLFLAGDHKLGIEWYRVLKAAEFKDITKETRLGPIARLAGGRAVRWTGTDLGRWATYQQRQQPKFAQKRILLLFALFEGLGEADQLQALWRKYIPAKLAVTLTSATPRKWRSLRAAAAQRRRGETVLRVVEALGAGDLGNVAPADLRVAIRSLRAVGLTAEARALAVEAALSAGL